MLREWGLHLPGLTPDVEWVGVWSRKKLSSRLYSKKFRPTELPLLKNFRIASDFFYATRAVLLVRNVH